MSKLNQLAQMGQSVWYDYIQRSLLDSEAFQDLIRSGLRGMTSNPTIFHKAIAQGDEYDTQLLQVFEQGKSIQDAYEAIVLQDIARAADLFRPVFDSTNGQDGYVSLEVSPMLAHDPHQTVEEAIRLFNQLQRPNVMIKVPATAECLPAITDLIGLGINVNVTLIFSIQQYQQVAEAYFDGLLKFMTIKGKPERVASVASFFVSRLDAKIDPLVQQNDRSDLAGKIAIAHSKVAFARFQELYSSTRWQHLAKVGARKQRLLWASTGVKSPDYDDTLYVDQLIGAETVNTIPPETLDAFIDHGTVKNTLEQDVDQAVSLLDEVSTLGIHLEEITGILLEEGVATFQSSWEQLLGAIERKKSQLVRM